MTRLLKNDYGEAPTLIGLQLRLDPSMPQLGSPAKTTNRELMAKSDWQSSVRTVAATSSARFMEWIRGSHRRILWVITFVWAVIVFVVVGGLGGPGIGAKISQFFAVLVTSAFTAFYLEALKEGPVARLDEQWRRGINEGRLPQWVGWLRLFFVVLPVWIFGWVPQKLYDLYFYQFYNAAISSVDQSTRILDELRNALRVALAEVWTIKNAQGNFDLGFCSSALYDMAKALVRAGLDREAGTVAAESLKVIPRVQELDETFRGFCVGDILRTLIVTKQYDEALRLAREPQTVLGPAVGTQERGAALRCVIASLAEDLGDFERALQLLPDVVDPEQRDFARGDLCKALALAGRLEDALEVIQRISDEAPSCWGSFYLSQASIALCDAGRTADALRFANLIVNGGSRQTALFSVAEALAKEGKTTDARALMELAMRIPCEERDWALFRASLVIAQTGDVEEALATAKKISGDNYHYGSAVQVICKVAARNGQIARALHIASELDGGKDKAIAEIAKGLAESGRTEEAESTARRIAGDEERSDALSAIAEGLARKGKISEAMEMVQHLPEEFSYRVLAPYDACVDTLWRAGWVDEAMEIIRSYSSCRQVEVLAKLYSEIRKSELPKGGLNYGVSAVCDLS